MIYWDTSAIVPLYIQESASEDWEKRLGESRTSAKSSTLAITEFYYALRQKVHRGTLESENFETLVALFEADCSAGLWSMYPLGRDVIADSLEIAKTCYALPKPVLLRSLDGLHLGAARVMGCDTVATGDIRLAGAAEAAGLSVIYHR